MPRAAAAWMSPIVGRELTDGQAALIAERFRAIADPTRIRILNLLVRHGELCVCEIVPRFDLSQPTISHHLLLLRRAGLVECSERGRWCYYRARPEMLAHLRSLLEVAP